MNFVQKLSLYRMDERGMWMWKVPKIPPALQAFTAANVSKPVSDRVVKTAWLTFLTAPNASAAPAHVFPKVQTKSSRKHWKTAMICCRTLVNEAVKLRHLYLIRTTNSIKTRSFAHLFSVIPVSECQAMFPSTKTDKGV